MKHTSMTAQVFSSPTVAILLLALWSTPAATFQPARPVVVPTPATTATNLDAVSRREALTTASSTAATALIAASFAVPSPASAADDNPYTQDKKQFAFNGVFRDPKHPKGFRIIAAAPNKQGTMTLQDDPDGQVFTIPLLARTDDRGSVEMTIDFTEKGGPSNVVATVNKKDSSVTFPDGNVWRKDTSGVVGMYIDGFAPYPKYRRIIRKAGNTSDIVVYLVSGKKTYVVSGRAAPGSKDIYIEFPGNKPCTGKFKNGIILFPDGNSWTRV